MAGGGKRRQKSGDVKFGRRPDSPDRWTGGQRKKIVFHLQIIDVGGGVDLFDREKKKGGVKRERGGLTNRLLKQREPITPTTPIHGWGKREPTP